MELTKTTHNISEPYKERERERRIQADADNNNNTSIRTHRLIEPLPRSRNRFLTPEMDLREFLYRKWVHRKYDGCSATATIGRNSVLETAFINSDMVQSLPTMMMSFVSGAAQSHGQPVCRSFWVPRSVRGGFRQLVDSHELVIDGRTKSRMDQLPVPILELVMGSLRRGPI